MSKTKKQSLCYEYAVDITPNVILLAFLAKMYKLDIETLLLIYNKIGEDLFYVFFLLAGKTMVLPKHTRMVKLSKLSRQLSQCVEDGEEFPEGSSRQEQEVLHYINSLIDYGAHKMIIKTEIPNVFVKE